MIGLPALIPVTTPSVPTDASALLLVQVPVLVTSLNEVVLPTQTVVVNPAPTVAVTPAGPVIKCTGGTQVLTATASGGTIQWYNGPSSPISGQTGTTYNP